MPPPPPPQTPQARTSFVEYLLSKTYDPATTTEKQFVHEVGQDSEIYGLIGWIPGNGVNVADQRGAAGKKRHVKAKLPRADIV